MSATLSDIQHWFQKIVMSPPDRSSPSTAADPDQVLVSTPGRSAAARLGVYQSAYQLRLLESLKEEFPRVRRLVGEEGFEQLATAYIDQNPSTHDNLSRLSTRFEAFLLRTRPETNCEFPDWTDVVVEAARLDAAIQQVFDGSGSEHRLSSGNCRFTAAATTAFSLEVCPSVRLLTLQFPVHEVPTLSNEPIPKRVARPPTEPTRLALYRRRYVVRWLECDEAAFSLLASLQQSLGLEDALTKTCESITLEAAELSRRFKSWGELGIIRTVPLN